MHLVSLDKNHTEAVGRAKQRNRRNSNPSPSPQMPSNTYSKSRLRPLIIKEPANPRAQVAEMASATAAGCVVLCCCCPCGIVSLVLVMAVKIPAALVRWALRRRRRLSGWAVNPKAGASVCDDDDDSLCLCYCVPDEKAWPAESQAPELVELEREMAAMFNGAGFWRSHSQRGVRA